MPGPHFVAVTAALAVFLGFGLLLIPYPGIENDEALFSGGIYAPGGMEWSVRLFGEQVAMMIMSYVGALKAWLYTPVLALWGPSPWSLRLPVLLAGALAVFLFYRLLARAAGRGAALIGCALLATDASFLLTATFDWGPVAIQQLLLVSGLLLLVSFHQDGGERRLAAGCFLLGLGLWDKAIFAWVLSGVTAAALILYWREIWKAVTPKRVALAGVAFALGASPFLAYNLTHSFETFQGKRYGFDALHQKLAVLHYTVRGDAMYGFLVDYASGHDRAPDTAVERGSVWLSEATGRRTTNWLLWIIAAGLAAAVWMAAAGAWRAVLFFPLAWLLAWLQMLVTVEAGGSAHHIVLLWPFLIGAIALPLGMAVKRLPRAGAVAVAAFVLAVAGSNVLVLNEYLAGLARYGPARMWTDAVYPLAAYLERTQPGIVYVADWGMGDTLRFYLKDETPLGNAIEPFFRKELDERESGQIIARVSHPGSVFVSYTDGWDMFPQAKKLASECAAAAGYRRETLQLIRDRQGRAVFEIYRFLPPEDER